MGRRMGQTVCKERIPNPRTKWGGGAEWRAVPICASRRSAVNDPYRRPQKQVGRATTCGAVNMTKRAREGATIAPPLFVFLFLLRSLCSVCKREQSRLKLNSRPKLVSDGVVAFGGA